jgi:hypothetical protein
MSKTCEGKTMQEIALEVGRSYSTIRSHRHNAYVRLGVSNGAEAVAAMFRSGWLDHVTLPVEERKPLPMFLKAYLTAFDEHLHSCSIRSREAMRHAFEGHRTLGAVLT